MENLNEKTQTVTEIKNILKDLEVQDKKEFVALYENDNRDGVKKLVDKANKDIVAYDNEIVRLNDMMKYERALYKKDIHNIAGVDEVGRGCLAGPVVVASVILPRDCIIMYANDSKKLSAKMREQLYDEIIEKAVAYSVSMIHNDTIDEINILQSTKIAMKHSIETLKVKPNHVLVDAVTIDGINIEQTPIIKGDEKSMTIACASIVAKVYRDRLMEQYGELFPEYDFANNKGYGSAKHIEAIEKYGLCNIHRRSFTKNFV